MNLVTPDQLGSLLSGVTEPDLWFLDELVACAGKVLARSRDERTRVALAEAAALVAYGRSWSARRALERAIGREPALAQPWLRTLVTSLNSGLTPTPAGRCCATAGR